MTRGPSGLNLLALREMTSLATSLAPATRKIDAVGTPVRLNGFESRLVVLLVGAIVDGTHTLQLEESLNGTDWTVVDDEDLAGDLPGAYLTADNQLAANTLTSAAYVGDAALLRARTTSTGATGATFAVLIVRGDPISGPATLTNPLPCSSGQPGQVLL